MTNIYLAHSIATTGEAVDSIRVANNIRELGYEVYAAAENKAINDKSNNPSPTDIYNGDVSKIIDCDVFVVNLSGGLQDGTISEIGLVTGLNERGANIPIIAYTSNNRLIEPQHYNGIPSASANHLVLGMIDKYGTFVGDELNLYEYLSKEKN